MKLRGACIQTHDAESLVGFYKKVFGYEPDVDGGVDYRFYKEQLVIFKLLDEKAPSTKDFALIYEVDDVDSEYERLADAGIPVGSPPTDKPWGVRSFIITDPAGNTVSFIRDIK